MSDVCDLLREHKDGLVKLLESHNARLQTKLDQVVRLLDAQAEEQKRLAKAVNALEKTLKDTTSTSTRKRKSEKDER